MIEYRTMTSGDIPAGLSLCRYYGWNQLARDWQLFLSMSPKGCCVAVDEAQRVVGTVTTIRYDHFSWIGMVLVDPDRQRQGIGGQLLKESLRILRDEEIIKLDATPAGREVYLKLDFVDEYRLSRMLWNDVSQARLSASIAQPMTESDLPPVIAMDREVFGADRKEVLQWSWEGAPQFAFVTKEMGKIKGYCFGRPGHNFIHLGPVVAQDHDQAIHLVSAALRNCTGPVIVDAPKASEEWIRWLSPLGFVEQRELIRMYRGSNPGPGVPENQFAILGPEFG